MFINVRGRKHEWSIKFYGDPAHLEEWRADGLEVNVIENTIPMLVADLGLVRPWVFLQDLLGFRNPFRK